jgi:hypothetical protein
MKIDGDHIQASIQFIHGEFFRVAAEDDVRLHYRRSVVFGLWGKLHVKWRGVDFALGSLQETIELRYQFYRYPLVSAGRCRTHRPGDPFQQFPPLLL